jgi:hypothetical protein
LDCYNQCLSGDVSMTVTSKRSDPHHVPCAVERNDVAATLTTAYADNCSPTIPATMGMGGASMTTPLQGMGWLTFKG